MLLPVSPATRIFLAAGTTDRRKRFEELSDWVRHAFAQDPLSGHLFVFVNRKKNRIQWLYADDAGVWLCAKRLHGRGPFAWPKTTAPGALRLLAEELTLLFSGIDLEPTRTRPWGHPAG